MIQKIDHIGIAVHSLKDALPLYTDVFGMKLEGMETVESQGVRVAFLFAGNTRIELLEALSEDSPIAAYLAKRGEGIHHIALGVEGIEKRIEDLKKHGLTMIDDTSRIGAHEAKVAFIHPKSTARILYELCEHPNKGEKK